MNNEIKIFEGNQIRSVWDNDKEEWYFSVVDVVGTLSDSKDPGAYWRKLKQRLKEEGSEGVTFCHGLKLKASGNSSKKRAYRFMARSWCKRRIRICHTHQ